ncbi:hypothetical protein [Streptomyces sp. NBC_01268]|uniref:hypothetical protein n=1 Tax=Streptomyces sp. NBC_01268 TaxID=2903806 RepID=UPI002E357597|nr:hypothetical protein [Streptomyces sp. NBC_01268]
MFPGPVRVFVPRFTWRTPSPDAPASTVWGSAFFDALCGRPDGWSLRDYWARSTFGLLDLQFTLSPGWAVLDRDQTQLRDDRNGMIVACREATEAAGQSLAGFDHVACFVNPPPCNAGAAGSGDLALDQAGSLEFFQHEVGHLLGFEHAWGRGGAYADPYCVMGWTGTSSHAIDRPAEFADVVTLAPDFWRSGRRPAAASLYRLFVRPEFGGSGSLTSGTGGAGAFDRRVVHARFGTDATVAALTRAGDSPVLAVANLDGGGVLTVEYRLPAGDDAGIGDPAVVVHTLGARSIGPGHHEVDPPWFETSFPPAVGLGATVAFGGTGYRVQVVGRQDEGVPNIRVSLIGSFPVPAYPHQQPGWRWCAKCQGLAFAFGTKVGECPVGGTHDHGPSWPYSLLHEFPAPAVQAGWRWCAKCQSLAFADGSTGPCQAGGSHDHTGSGAYHLLHGVEPMAGEAGWRWCAKCQVLASGLGTPGPCAAGGRHDHTTSGNYSMQHDVTLPTAQSGWHECGKCRALVFADGSPGPCPGSGAHQPSTLRTYQVLHDLKGLTSQDDWRWCRNCQGLAFGGGGAGACPTGGVHDLSASGNYTLLHGVRISQADWKWCARCQGLAYAGGEAGRCPAGGTHDHTASGNYSMLPEPPQVW